jgi:hypothetical protein
MRRYGAYGVLREEGEDDSRTFCDADIDEILEQAVEVRCSARSAASRQIPVSSSR